jgi:hypothetical protein
MAYKNNIPAPNDQISKSQSDLLGNFSALDTTFGINHLPFSDSTNPGKHTIIDLSVQSSDPVAPTNFQTLYSKGYNLWTRTPSGSPEKISGTIFTAVENGQLILPCGMYMQWGKKNVTFPNTPVSINLPGAIDHLQVTMAINGSAGPGISARGSINNVGAGNNSITLELTASASGYDVYWFLIGH